jgi:outer membrane lipoprotein-sorting protein
MATHGQRDPKESRGNVLMCALCANVPGGAQGSTHAASQSIEEGLRQLKTMSAKERGT